MLTPILSQKELFDLLRIIQESRRIVICGHRVPTVTRGGFAGPGCLSAQSGQDGEHRDAQPVSGFPEMAAGSIVCTVLRPASRQVRQLVEQADLIFCLDFNSESRLEAWGL